MAALSNVPKHKIGQASGCLISFVNWAEVLELLYEHHVIAAHYIPYVNV